MGTGVSETYRSDCAETAPSAAAPELCGRAVVVWVWRTDATTADDEAEGGRCRVKIDVEGTMTAAFAPMLVARRRHAASTTTAVDRYEGRLDKSPSSLLLLPLLDSAA